MKLPLRKILQLPGAAAAVILAALLEVGAAAPPGRFGVHNRQIEDYGVVHGGNSARPGFIVAADSSMYDAAEAARRQWIVDTCNAWRSDAERRSDDAAPPRGPIADPAEAQRVCREARDRYIRELQDAWRR